MDEGRKVEKYGPCVLYGLCCCGKTRNGGGEAEERGGGRTVASDLNTGQSAKYGHRPREPINAYARLRRVLSSESSPPAFCPRHYRSFAIHLNRGHCHSYVHPPCPLLCLLQCQCDQLITMHPRPRTGLVVVHYNPSSSENCKRYGSPLYGIYPESGERCCPSP